MKELFWIALFASIHSIGNLIASVAALLLTSVSKFSSYRGADARRVPNLYLGVSIPADSNGIPLVGWYFCCIEWAI